jgi:hypothetical protein
MDTGYLPPELNQTIASHEKDFAVKAKRAYPLAKTLNTLIFSFVWLILTTFFAYVMIGPIILQGKTIQMEINDVPTMVGPDNLWNYPIIPIFLGFFYFMGFILLITGFYYALAKGPWFVGTREGLIVYNGRKTHTVAWNEFSGGMTAYGDTQQGSLILQLLRSKAAKYGRKYVQDKVYMIGIPKPYQVQEACKKRISETQKREPKAMYDTVIN